MIVGKMEIKAKSSATSRSSTTAVTADPDLTIDLEAGTYLINAYLRITAPATPDVRIAPLCTTAPDKSLFTAVINESENEASASWSTVGMLGAVWAGTTLTNADPTSGWIGSDTSGYKSFVHLQGVMTISSSGTFSVGWAQQTSNASSTTLEQDSFMTVHRIA